MEHKGLQPHVRDTAILAMPIRTVLAG